MHQRPVPTNRRAFTLIELIVVITIMVLVAGIALYVAPRLEQTQRATRGAEQLSTWLLIAKQRALRDRVPTGLRLVVDGSGQFVREVQYVQQPDSYNGRFPDAFVQTPGDPYAEPNPIPAQFVGVDFYGGTNGVVADQSIVQPGDYVEINGGGLLTQVLAVPRSDQLFLWRPLIGVPTRNFRILRQPRRIAGEEPLPLPQDVAIDLGLSIDVPVRTVILDPIAGTTADYREIMFSPNGGVIDQGTRQGRIILWVRDSSRDSALEGEPVLISIQVRTGMIASNPVDTGSPDPYSFTRDPRASGM
jgi:prepilin-type N-terminal cleavage/methylation domain-containing protein